MPQLRVLPCFCVGSWASASSAARRGRTVAMSDASGAVYGRRPWTSERREQRATGNDTPPASDGHGRACVEFAPEWPDGRPLNTRHADSESPGWENTRTPLADSRLAVLYNQKHGSCPLHRVLLDSLYTSIVSVSSFSVPHARRLQHVPTVALSALPSPCCNSLHTVSAHPRPHRPGVSSPTLHNTPSSIFL